MKKFIIVRDAYGLTQVLITKPNVFVDKNGNSINGKLSLESVIAVKGCVRRRPENQINLKFATGEIEVEAEKVTLLNECTFAPLVLREQQNVLESTRLTYRYIDLRSEEMQNNLRFRSHFVSKIRNFLLNECAFVEIETPYLTLRTPGVGHFLITCQLRAGAQEFVVPTRFPGKYYVLAQSPQQFKQLLMIGAMDRYFQIARCFRDEGAKIDRQPEFTQVNLCVLSNLVENLLKAALPFEVKTPFPRISYKESINDYGTDKPDMRLSFKLKDLSSSTNLASEKQKCVAFALKDGFRFLNKQLKSLEKSMQETCESLSFKGKIVVTKISENLVWDKRFDEAIRIAANKELNLNPGDILFLAIGQQDEVYQIMGKMRNECVQVLMKLEEHPYSSVDKFSFVWILDFPLFFAKEDGKLECAHHPFTAPIDEHKHKLYEDPLNTTSQHFDLVLNGEEIGGGSVRIYDSQMQSYVFEKILRENVSSMQFFLDALKSGCPPHAGIALGLDRLVAILCNASSIKSVMAFPKSSNSKDLMTNAPSAIDEESKRLYNIKD
ncbi:aspartate--tRNA ligase-like protein [Dinothrombium tinctorium]|uniref:Aspartate--tRNA ligase-like protein n=1 Tax=Dinothrombium tinctorium TaxID=1965070 RepID=A0A3S3P782_9ACAR|nr:aspartate--tRNA ligase-like protein [Dinothrombium tinctorium]